MANENIKPSELIEWAESAAGGDVTDPGAVRTAGYLFEEALPHDEFNYLLRAIGRFAKWHESSSGQYQNSAVAYDTIADNGTCIIFPSVAGFQGEPFEVSSGGAFLNLALVTTMHCDGRWLILGYDTGTSARIRVYDLSDGSLADTLTPGNTPDASGIVKVLSDGVNLVAIYNNSGTPSGYLETWTLDSDGVGTANGSVTWTGGSAAVRAMAMGNDEVLLMGDNGTNERAVVYNFDGTLVGSPITGAAANFRGGCWTGSAFMCLHSVAGGATKQVDVIQNATSVIQVTVAHAGHATTNSGQVVGNRHGLFFLDEAGNDMIRIDQAGNETVYADLEYDGNEPLALFADYDLLYFRSSDGANPRAMTAVDPRSMSIVATMEYSSANLLNFCTDGINTFILDASDDIRALWPVKRFGTWIKPGPAARTFGPFGLVPFN